MIETTDHGYVLRVPAAAIDAHAFAEQVGAAGRVLAPLASQFDVGPTAGWPTRAEVLDAVDRLDDVLATWGGEPYADLPDHPDVVSARSSLERLRASAEEARLLGLLAVGDHAGVLATTESATARNPMDEGLWATHALALVRAGRQADALEALRTVRASLVEELGIDPGSRLRVAGGGGPAPGPRDRAGRWRRPGGRHLGPAAGAFCPCGRSGSTGAAATVGRQAEVAVLSGLLERATSGAFTAPRWSESPESARPAWSPTWPTDAREQGFTVAWGRCSQDDGAPPLWPWRSVLEVLGESDGRGCRTTGPGGHAGAGRLRAVGRHRAPCPRHGRVASAADPVGGPALG